MINPSENQPKDVRPNWLIGVQVEANPVRIATIDGQDQPYTVVRTGLQPGWPYVTGLKDGQLFISEDAVPEDVLHILGHEVRHTTKFKDDTPEESCTNVMKTELADVEATTPDRLNGYIKRRMEFFRALCPYYAEHPEGRTPEEIVGFNNSLAYLEERVRDLPQE